MARCEDCIHHECCVRFAGARTILCGDKADERCKLYKPTAEVVPKSEVDRLNAVMKDMDEQRAYTINMLGENLENAKSEVERLQAEIETLKDNNEHLAVLLEEAKQEVAREIFEEIYEDCFDQFGYIDYEALAELKKKYTEEKT